jgi:hypothetical protein
MGGIQRDLGRDTAGGRGVRPHQAGMPAPQSGPGQGHPDEHRARRDHGTNHPNFGNAAVAGPDTATGNGLVDANRAVLLAKVRCLALPLIPFLPSCR